MKTEVWGYFVQDMNWQRELRKRAILREDQEEFAEWQEQQNQEHQQLIDDETD